MLIQFILISLLYASNLITNTYQIHVKENSIFKKTDNKIFITNGQLSLNIHQPILSCQNNQKLFIKFININNQQDYYLSKYQCQKNKEQEFIWYQQINNQVVIIGYGRQQKLRNSQEIDLRQIKSIQSKQQYLIKRQSLKQQLKQYMHQSQAQPQQSFLQKYSIYIIIGFSILFIMNMLSSDQTQQKK